MMEAQYLVAGGLNKSDGQIMRLFGQNPAAIGQIIPCGQILRDNGQFRRVIGQIMTFIGQNLAVIGQIIPHGQILRDNGQFRRVIGQIMTFIGQNLAVIGQIIPHGQIRQRTVSTRHWTDYDFHGQNLAAIGQIIPCGQIFRDNGQFRIVIGQIMPFYRLKTAAIGQIGWIIGQKYVKNGRQTKAEGNHYGEHLHS
ncbi:hypothetical protein [Bacillus sp. SJS]|uniref:hypothetical protein n=1 Tax=Bacillus sp. SJS TaxID=1423321 RepID=UPI0012E78552|nr:hypothetical protein [Bacillus sp. SJS]